MQVPLTPQTKQGRVHGYHACCRFFCFYVVLFLVHQTAAAMFRVIAALTRNLVLATSLGSLFLVIYLMLSGFIQAQRMSSPNAGRSSILCTFSLSHHAYH